jgi:glutamate/tyrosine decarboxylase-like PLP-dependent enzyme
MMTDTIEDITAGSDLHELADGAAEIDLDPDWDTARQVAHRAIDGMIDYLRDVGERPVWQAPPPGALDRLRADAPLPVAGTDLGAVVAQVQRDVLPYPVGNISPRFWGWVMGSGTMSGVLGEVLAATMNTNAVGMHQSANYVEEQLLSWLAQIMGMPASAGGITVGGAAEANLIGLTAARDYGLRLLGVDARGDGLQQLPAPLVGYCSVEGHVVLDRAFRLLGLGHGALRKIPSGPDYRMDLAALERAIATDRAAGRHPFVVCGSVGTVNTGAIDPLPEIAALCVREQLWMHVDGAFGAAAAFSPRLKPLLAGMERADSLAFDGHKWLHMPYGTAFALLRDPATLRTTFAAAVDAVYTQASGRGPLSVAPGLTDRGIDFSRRFNALAAWMLIREAGVVKLGRLVEQNVAQAQYLAGLVERAPDLELAGPVPLNVVCFRYTGAGLDDAHLNAVNQEIVARLQEEGRLMPSGTTLRGRYAVRVAITNHRSRRADFDLLVSEVQRIGAELT